MITKKLQLCALICSTSLNVMAENSVIDFEDHFGCSSKVVGGHLQIVNSRGTICSQIGSSTNAVSSGSRFSNEVRDLIITQVDNQPFTPISMRVGEYSISVAPPSPLTVTGVKPDGSEVHLNIYFDEDRDGPGGIDDFQSVLFPPSFADVIRVECGPGSWSLDDLVADAPASPPVTPGPSPSGQFNSAVKILALPSTIIGYTRTPLVLLDDYTFQEEEVVDSILDARNQNLNTVIGVQTRVIDSVRFDFYEMEGETSAILRHTPDGSSEAVVTLAQVQAWFLAQFGRSGYDVQSLRISAAHDGRLLFQGEHLSGSDSYYLLVYDVDSESISMLISPDTELPSEIEPALPWYFPDYGTIGEGGIAFDSSTTVATSDEVVFEQPAGSSSIRRIISEDDDTGFGEMIRIEGITYQGADLVIGVVATMGRVRLVYRNGLLISSSLTRLDQAIVAEAITYQGDAAKSDAGARFVNTEGAVYQSHEGSLYRIVGPNTVIAGSEVTSATYLATSASDTDKILVRIYTTDSSVDGLYEITLSQLSKPAIEIGDTFIWPDPYLFYIPVNYATTGKAYTLYKSYDLVDWEIESVITTFEDRPRFNYSANGDSSVFFKVEETEQP